MVKRWLYALLCCWLFLGFGTVSATYQITDAQLTRLETIFNELETENRRLQALQIQSSADLQTAQEALKNYETKLAVLQAQLTALRSETTKLKESLTETDSALQKAEQSLNKYERRQDRLEHQNKMLKWGLGAGLLYAIIK